MLTPQAKLVLEWTPEFSVGVVQLDAEHQKFFQLTQNLYGAIATRSSRAVVGALLGELYAYSVEHMTHEEDILERFNYPELEAHRREHKQFRDKIREYMEEFDAGRYAMALPLLQFLQEWQNSHIQNIDRRYTHFLQAKGLQ